MHKSSRKWKEGMTRFYHPEEDGPRLPVETTTLQAQGATCNADDCARGAGAVLGRHARRVRQRPDGVDVREEHGPRLQALVLAGEAALVVAEARAHLGAGRCARAGGPRLVACALLAASPATTPIYPLASGRDALCDARAAGLRLALVAGTRLPRQIRTPRNSLYQLHRCSSTLAPGEPNSLPAPPGDPAIPPPSPIPIGRLLLTADDWPPTLGRQ